MSKIAFIKSDERKYNVERSLSLIKSEIIAGLKGKRRVVIKPNCVSSTVGLAATHADALEAVLEFIQPYVESQVTVAEGTGLGSTMEAFNNFGYFTLQNHYGFAIRDLNTDDFEIINLINRHGKQFPAKVAKTLLKADYIISVSPPKTHDYVVYTGAVKNVAVGALTRADASLTARVLNRVGLIRNYKTAIHQGNKAINENIRRVYEHLPIKLAILDGFEAMQGDGPINGEMVPCHWAISSTDPLATDWLACQLMGIDVADVGYLTLLGANQSDHLIAGDRWQNAAKRFKMHPNFAKSRHWH